MKIKLRRPIIWVAICYGLGILIGTRGGGSPSLVFGGAALLLFFGISFLNRIQVCVVLLSLSFVMLGWANALLRVAAPDPLKPFVNQNVVLSGYITEHAGHEENRDTYIVHINRVRAREKEYNVSARIQLTIYLYNEKQAGTWFEYGDKLQIKSRLEKPNGRRNPGGFDYRAYLARRGINEIVGVTLEDITFMGRVQPSPWVSLKENTRKGLEGIFDKYVGGREGELVKAMVLGERWLLPSDIKTDFSHTGLAHILAISGLHVGFIIVLLRGLTTVLGLPGKVSFIIQVVVLGLYCMLVGATPSAVRAAIMTVILLGGKVLGRKPDPINSLAIAAFLILIVQPLDLFEVGFQLSFGAVAGIALYYRWLQERMYFFPVWAASTLAVIFAAQLGTSPIIAYYFNILSPISVFANMIMVPLAALIVTTGFCLVPVGIIAPPLGKVFGWVLKLACFGMLEGNRLLATLPLAFIHVVSPTFLFLVIYYFVLWILSKERPCWIKKPVVPSGAMIGLLIFSALIHPVIDNNLKVVFVDVGQGDCIFIKTPDERCILVDGGGRPEGIGNFSIGDDVVVPFLLKNGISRLDLVIMSHAHDDHIGGLIPVVRDLGVKAFMEFPPGEETRYYTQLKSILKAKGVPCLKAVAGQSWKVGSHVVVDVLYPVQDYVVLQRLYQRDENNRSLVLRISYKDTSILLTGDIESNVEAYLSQQWAGRADIIKVAHHGSKTSSADEWLEAVNPEIAVIQVGKNNFGHPHPSVVDRLNGYCTKVLRNDIHGGVICTYSGSDWRVQWMVHE